MRFLVSLQRFLKLNGMKRFTAFVALVLLAAAAAVYGAAVPFNLVHAASSAVFLYFLAEPMGQKLERIKLKYGLGFAKGARL